MNITLFLAIFIFVTYLIYLMTEETTPDEIKVRLEKYSLSKAKKPEAESKAGLKESFLLLIRPFVKNTISKSNNRKTLKQMLLEAGKSATDEEVLKIAVKRVAYAILGGLAGFALFIMTKKDETSLLMMLLFPMTAYIIPTFELKKLGKYRSDEITYNLPDVLDLLTVCVEAGLGLDSALARVAKEYMRTSPILASEMGRVSNDINAGIPRQEAFRNLSARNASDDLKTLSALLVQTDKLGTSIGQALRTYSDTTRTRRRQRVEELSQQASVKMIVPLVLFILPAMFVIILGPAAISLLANFSQVK